MARGGKRIPASGRYKYGKKAEGHKARAQSLMLAVACRFDDETFAQIQSLALKEDVSFSQKVRDLVEIGLEESK